MNKLISIMVSVLLAVVIASPLVLHAGDTEIGSDGTLPGQPFQILQDLLEASITPPIIIHTFSPGTPGILDINFNFSDENELAYYAYQDQNTPANNIMIFVEPGLNLVDDVLTLDLNPGDIRRILVVASDVHGNVGKVLLEIEYSDFF